MKPDGGVSRFYLANPSYWLPWKRLPKKRRMNINSLTLKANVRWWSLLWWQVTVYGDMGIDLVESLSWMEQWGFSMVLFIGEYHPVFASNCARPKIVLSANSLFKQSVPFYAVRDIRMSVVRDENSQLLDYKITDVNKACSTSARPAWNVYRSLASEIYPVFLHNSSFWKKCWITIHTGKRISFPADVFIPLDSLFSGKRWSGRSVLQIPRRPWRQ